MDGVLLLACGLGIVTRLIHFISWKTNKLVLKAKSISVTRGALRVQTIDIPYSKINSVSVSRGFFLGSITIMTGNDVNGIVFSGIDNAQQIKNAIEQRL